MKPLSIIIPTWNNEEYLNPCVMSIIRTGILDGMADLIIVNNGKQDIERMFGRLPGIKILNPGENLGWEGGLALGMKESETPFAVFQNDDTFIPQSSCNIYQRMLINFQDKNVAAVGPTTTVAAGIQSIYHPSSPLRSTEVSYLIFFTVMVRRSHYDAVGGIDTTLPGGDDFDLSMRFRKAGYNIVVDPAAFLIHHGFKTGIRVKGDPSTAGGWNSVEMTDRTNKHLIQKHGFHAWWTTLCGLKYDETPAPDKEGDIIRAFVNGDKNIVELGCGPQKTIERAIGIDRIPGGEVIPHLQGKRSIADIVADVEQPLPLNEKSQDIVIARHILEHCLDSVRTIHNWRKVIRPGGKLILAVPDESVTSGIPVNPEHVHAFSEGSLSSLMEACGFRTVMTKSAENGVSFVGCYERLN